jgi:hypothetical protein
MDFMRTIRVALSVVLFSSFALAVAAQTKQPVTFQQLAELTASDGETQDYLGFSLAMSGNTIVAGAPQDPNTEAGKAYVFVKPAAGWANATQTAELTPSDGIAGLGFGFFVAISGNTIAVCAGADYESSEPAAIYVFVEPSGGWTDMTETAKLVLPNPFEQGSLAINANTIAVGWTGFNFDQGEIYLYIRPADGWRNGLQPRAILTASDGQPDDFLGVSSSFYGDTLVAAAANDGAYVFVKPPGGWTTGTQTAKLTESGGTGSDGFGSSIAIYGGTIVVGAPDTGTRRIPDYGTAYLYYEPSSGWADATQNAEIRASDFGSMDYFAGAVAVTGTLVAVGASGDVNGGTGAAYVFKGAHQTAELTPVDGMEGEGMGYMIAASGNTVVAGAVNAPVGANSDQGALYVFAPH